MRWELFCEIKATDTWAIWKAETNEGPRFEATIVRGGNPIPPRDDREGCDTLTDAFGTIYYSDGRICGLAVFTPLAE